MRTLTHLAALVALLLVSATSAFAGSVNLAWDAVNDPRVSGYKVYYGTSSRTYTGQIDVGNATTRTVSNLIDGATYYFAVTVYDASRVESGLLQRGGRNGPRRRARCKLHGSTTTGAGTAVAELHQHLDRHDQHLRLGLRRRHDQQLAESGQDLLQRRHLHGKPHRQWGRRVEHQGEVQLHHRDVGARHHAALGSIGLRGHRQRQHRPST